jgi:serine/threonine protein kinase
MRGSILARRYTVLQVLGVGGFGETYIAEDMFRPGNPKCVVKRLRSQISSPETITIIQNLFNAEAELLEKLGKHPRIPALLAHFEENNEFYLVQEFIDGNTLDSEIMQGQRLSEVQVVELLTEILDILFFIHNRRVIHRDVKPNNIIRRKEDERLFLIDFGAVKQISGIWGEDDIAIGTIGYAPPEQMSGERPRLNSDIYALGITAIQALTGLRPPSEYSYTSDNVLWHHHLPVNEKLADILDKMVCSDYRKRYQSAIQVLDDLRNIGEVSDKINETSDAQTSVETESRDSMFSRLQIYSSEVSEKTEEPKLINTTLLRKKRKWFWERE